MQVFEILYFHAPVAAKVLDNIDPLEFKREVRNRFHILYQHITNSAVAASLQTMYKSVNGGFLNEQLDALHAVHLGIYASSRGQAWAEGVSSCAWTP